MSNKYIHEDLHRLVEKYFDSLNASSAETENYNGCRYIDSHNQLHDHYNEELIDSLCERESFNILKKMIDSTCDNIAQDGLQYACEIGNIKLMNFFIDNDAHDWNEGLGSACYGGHIDIIRLMIEKGANNFSEALFNSCEGNSLEIVKLIVKKGSKHWDDDDWKYGLHSSKRGGNVEIIKYMTKKNENIKT